MERQKTGVRSQSKKLKRPVKKGQKLDKGESLYSPELAVRARQIIIEAQLIKTDGNLHYAKIARILHIPSRTFSRWRNSNSQYYKPEFVQALAEAHDELLENLQSGKIKQAMIKRALPYTRIKKTKERMVKGPKMPAMSGMDLKGLRLAALKLGIQVDKTMTRGILKVKIAAEVVKQTEEVMVTTRQEEERMHGDVAAAKLVLPNIGPKDKRWTEKTDVKLNVDGLSKLLEEIDGSGSRLPSKASA